MKEKSPKQERRERADQRYRERLAAVAPYANMGMSRRELDFALIIGANQDFTKAVIDDVLARGKRHGHIRILTKEEETLIRQDNSAMTDEQAQDRVLKCLIVKETLAKREAKMPEDRGEWNKVIEAIGDIDRPLGIVKNLLNRGASIADAAQIARLEYPETQEPIVRFAQELVANSMINQDLLSYNELIRICREKGVELPTFAHSIVLEAFFSARIALDRKDDTRPISAYHKLRGMFVNEEDSDESLSLAQFEDSIVEINADQRYKEDGIGLYRLSEDGGKYRMPVGVDDKGIAYDSTTLMQAREASRERVARSREGGGRQTKPAQQVLSWEINHPLDGNG